MDFNEVFEFDKEEFCIEKVEELLCGLNIFQDIIYRKVKDYQIALKEEQEKAQSMINTAGNTIHTDVVQILNEAAKLDYHK